MHCRMVDMRNKQVVNIKTGACIGCVCDVEVDTKTAQLVAIIIYGKLKWFGIFGREDDIIIRWEDIIVIGEDSVLVKFNMQSRKKRRKFNFLNNFFKF